MSRLTDTRQLTRETADKLVAAGRSAAELTVDLIYAEIRQGSRSTINDELKRWKLDQQRADGLEAQLPPDVALAMRELWSQAVEQGRAVFEQQRAELEEQARQAQQLQQAADQALVEARARIEVQESQQRLQQVRLGELEQALAELGSRHAEASRTCQALEQQLAAQREAAREQLADERRAHEEALASERRKLADQEAALRAELAKATERLEAVQRHIMRQVDDARDAQKRAEQSAAQATARSERLAGELEGLRLQTATQSAQLAQLTQAREAVQASQLELARANDGLLARVTQLETQLEQAQAAVLAGRHPRWERLQRRRARRDTDGGEAPGA